MKINYKCKCLLVLFLLLFCFIEAKSQERTFDIIGIISDYISGNALKAKVELMTPDSVVVDSAEAQIGDSQYGTMSIYTLKAHQKGKYIVHAFMEGYIDGYATCEVHSNRQNHIFPKKILLQKKEQIHQLQEVLVTATKLKMVVRGDTLVYNADAFNLAEGSMLDALISRLPGTKLTRDGQIFVKGKKVESLLVNGNGLFSENPQLALQNLPAYIVNNVKVYDKSGIASEMMGRDMGDKMLVMDVILKREYAKNYIGNLEGGVGSNDRNKIRGFALKFSDKEQIVGFFNMNNLNDNEQASLGGNWTPQDVPNGLLTKKTAGISYNNKLGDLDFFSAEMHYDHTGTDNQALTNTQTFLPMGDTFLNSRSKDVSTSDMLKGNASLEKSVKNLRITNKVYFSWHKRKGMGNSLSETRDSVSVLNRMLYDNSYETHDFYINLNSNNSLFILQVDYLSFSFDFSYDRLLQNSFSLSDVTYSGDNTLRDYRNNYLDATNQDLKFNTNVGYSYALGSSSISLAYDYDYQFNKTPNMLYRLDKIAGRDSTHFNVLPSAAEAMAEVLDKPNSYDYRQYTHNHKLRPTYSYHSKNYEFNFSVSVPFKLINSKLHYNRLGYHEVSRQRLFPEPSFSIWSNSRLQWRFDANMSSSIPDLTTMVDYRDDADPLNIRLGNSNLKDIHQYDVKFSMSKHGSMQRQFYANIGYHKTDNSVAYGLTFDKKLGISTTQPVSVDGVWGTDANIGYNCALDSLQKLTIGNTLDMVYNHNVDMATVKGYTDSQRSIVNNWSMGDNINLNFRPNDNYEFSLHTGGNYYLINSKREDFRSIHAGDYNLGFNATLYLPWKFQFSTDITMFARRGYQQAEMNTTDWVWNAQLTHSFVKGHLLAKLSGFDILHQLSTTQYAVNSQGRTETWRNSIPNYLMLSLSWRFNVNPKKK